MKKKISIFCLIAAYFLLLLILTAVEAPQSDSQIRTFGDALWYSIVTMTTVGYGDLFPVTVPGKLIGVLFLMMSVGALAFLFSTIYALLSGRLIPDLRLWRFRRRCWYLFSELNEETEILAAEMLRTDPESIAIFGNVPSGQRVPDRRWIFRQDGFPELGKGHNGKDDILFFWSLEEDNGLAAAAYEGPERRIARSTGKLLPPQIQTFDCWKETARLYWRNHPLQEKEQKVLILGEGVLAEAMLTQALLTNIRLPFQQCQYHVFGNWTEYHLLHSQISRQLAPQEGAGESDSLEYHSESWLAYPDLLREADRILLCGEKASENEDAASRILTWLPVSGRLHVFSEVKIPGTVSFGEKKLLLSRENVLREGMNALAKALHQRYCEATGADLPAWEALELFLRESNAASADHLYTKVGLLLPGAEFSAESCAAAWEQYRALGPEEQKKLWKNEHLRWVRFYSFYNWTYGPEKNARERWHPCLRPFEELSQGDQEKDSFAWEQLETAAEILKGEKGE